MSPGVHIAIAPAGGFRLILNNWGEMHTLGHFASMQSVRQACDQAQRFIEELLEEQHRARQSARVMAYGFGG